jgi:predicted transcriptional regulator
MKTVSLRVPDAVDARVSLMAQREGLSRSEFIRKSIEESLARGAEEPAGSFLELAGDLAGIVEGAEDLSVAQHHMEGYGA